MLGVAAKAAKSTLINVGPTLSIFQPPVELITCSTLTTWLINVELIDYAAISTPGDGTHALRVLSQLVKPRD